METTTDDRSAPTGELNDEERYELFQLNCRLTEAYNTILRRPYDPNAYPRQTKVYIPAKEKGNG